MAMGRIRAGAQPPNSYSSALPAAGRVGMCKLAAWALAWGEALGPACCPQVAFPHLSPIFKPALGAQKCHHPGLHHQARRWWCGGFPLHLLVSRLPQTASWWSGLSFLCARSWRCPLRTSGAVLSFSSGGWHQTGPRACDRPARKPGVLLTAC